MAAEEKEVVVDLKEVGFVSPTVIQRIDKAVREMRICRETSNRYH